MPGQPRIFTTRDFLGNMVDFYTDTWSNHILVDHPDMAPYEQVIQVALNDPTGIRLSTDSQTALVFEKTVEQCPPEDLVRIIVKYDDLNFRDGLSTGRVATAFPKDSRKYGRSKVGPFIYQKESND